MIISVKGYSSLEETSAIAKKIQYIIDAEGIEAFVIPGVTIHEWFVKRGVHSEPAILVENQVVWEGGMPPREEVIRWLHWPKTLEDVVERILSNLDKNQKQEIVAYKESDLWQLHMTLGQFVRNSFGLFGGNKELLESCGSGDMDADEASGIILRKVWMRLTIRLEPDEANVHSNLGYSYNNEGTITDIDRNVYQTVKIGNQVWMAENLRTTKYNDGSPIPQVTDDAAWANLKTPAYCYYDNTTNADSITKYGALYNWFAVDTKKLAPKGWHVPTDVEWDTLRNYLIANGYNWDGTTTGNKIAKSMAAKKDWDTHPTGTIGKYLTTNNKSGFSALPGGCRVSSGVFSSIGGGGFWWSATEDDASLAFYRLLGCGFVSLSRYGILKSSGFSVRLLRS